jgi:filamentous hemagglutinin family protein
MNIRTSRSRERSPKSRERFARSHLAIAAAMLLGPPPLMAAPFGGVVTSGAASISQAARVTRIDQSTQKAAINWKGFSISPSETVNFNQPNASAVTLNRVIGNERSVIEGALNANGQVFLVNSNGVLFTRGSRVNAAGLVASTLDIGDADFQAGNYVFAKGAGAGGSVVNMGTVNASEGGYVALLGQQVANEGVIVATKGNVALASGDKVALNFNGDSLLNVSIEQGALDALVENKGAIYADGGRVVLTARAADELLGAQVNSSGIVQARTIDDLKGSIEVYAHGGTAAIAGTLDASAPGGGDGGFIETSGDTVKIADGASITTASAGGKTGTWLVDPDGFTIANSGGDISATLLSNLLASNNIALESTQGSGTGGDIDVNDAVGWAADTALTLTATHDVNLNAAVTASGDAAGLTLNAGNDINVNANVTLSGQNAALAMNYGGDYHILTPATYSGAVLDAEGKPVANQAPEGTQYASITLSGANASLDINGNAYTLVHSMEQLAALDDATGTATGYFALGEDLDAAAWSDANTGQPSVIRRLSGTLAGLGHDISNLSLNANSTSYMALIGEARASSIWDIGLPNVSVTTTSTSTRNYTAALLGYGELTDVHQAYAIGEVKGRLAGGLIGYFIGDGRNASNPIMASVTDSFADVDVSSVSYAGGLIGRTSYVSIANSHASGDVGTSGAVGGLVGYAVQTNIADSYATGNVTGANLSSPGVDSGAGGLVGAYQTGTQSGTARENTYSVINSFATGKASGGTEHVGGLIGLATGGGNLTVENAYATGDVEGVTRVGGLVGSVDITNQNNIIFDRTFATGNVVATGDDVGGLIGRFNSLSVGGDNQNIIQITNSFATGDVTSGGNGVGGFIGSIFGSTQSGGHGMTISDSYYGNGTVSGAGMSVGGFVGRAQLVVISDSYTQATVVEADSRGGGFAGYLGPNATLENVYFNSTEGAVGIVDSAPDRGDSTEPVGLTSAEFSDIQHYLNGTIDQVIADRAAQAEAAAAQAAAEAAAQAAAEAAAQAAAEAVAQQAIAQAAVETAAQRSAAQSAVAQGAAQVATLQQSGSTRAPSNAVFSQIPPRAPVDSHIVLADDTGRYSLGVQRIEIDGEIFELNEKDKQEK